MTEEEIIAALSVLTWKQRTDQTFADSLRRQTDSERRAHVHEIGHLYRAMLVDARERPISLTSERPEQRAGNRIHRSG